MQNAFRKFMSVLLGPGGGTAFGRWGNYFGPMEELLLAVGGTALGYWGNCLCPMGELLLANGGLISANGRTGFSHSLINIII